MLPESNQIFCHLLRIIFGNNFLMISSKVEEHLWLFLNNLSIYEKIHCYIFSYALRSNNLNATLHFMFESVHNLWNVHLLCFLFKYCTYNYRTFSSIYFLWIFANIFNISFVKKVFLLSIDLH